MTQRQTTSSLEITTRLVGDFSSILQRKLSQDNLKLVLKRTEDLESNAVHLGKKFSDLQERLPIVKTEDELKDLVNSFFTSRSDGLPCQFFYWAMIFMRDEDILIQLVTTIPELFSELPTTAWLQSSEEGIYAEESVLYYLSKSRSGQATLRSLLTIIPDLFSKLPMEAWFQSPKKGIYAGKTALHCLSKHEDGRTILERLLDRSSELSSKFSVGAWLQSPDEIRKGIVQFLYNLTQDETGQKILTQLTNRNPVFLESFYKFPEEFKNSWLHLLESRNSKVLHWLSRAPLGQKILIQLVAYITYIPSVSADISALDCISQRLAAHTNWIVENTPLDGDVANIITTYATGDYFAQYQERVDFMLELTELRAGCSSFVEEDDKAQPEKVKRLNRLVSNPIAQVYFDEKPLLAASILSQQWPVLNLENKNKLLRSCVKEMRAFPEFEVFSHRHLFRLLSEVEAGRPIQVESLKLLITLLDRCFSVVSDRALAYENFYVLNELLSLLNFKRMVFLLHGNSRVREWFKEAVARADELTGQVDSLASFKLWLVQETRISTFLNEASLLESLVEKCTDDLSCKRLVWNLMEDFLAKLASSKLVPGSEVAENREALVNSLRWMLRHSDVETLEAELRNQDFSRAQESGIFRNVGLICWLTTEKGLTSHFFGRFLLHNSVLHHHRMIAQLLLGVGVSMDVPAEDNRTLFSRIGNDSTIAELLLFLGVKGDVQNEEKQTPLHSIATHAGSSVDLLKLLMEVGSSVNTQDSKMSTPLHEVTCSEESSSIVWLLLKHGADVNAQNQEGHSPLYIAAQHKCGAIVQLLFAAGADMRGIDGTDNPEITQFILENVFPGSMLLGGKNVGFEELAVLEKAQVKPNNLPKHYQPFYCDLFEEVNEDKSTDNFLTRLVYAIGGLLQKIDSMTAFPIERYLMNLTDHLQSDKLLVESLDPSDLANGKRILTRLHRVVEAKHEMMGRMQERRTIDNFGLFSPLRQDNSDSDASQAPNPPRAQISSF